MEKIDLPKGFLASGVSCEIKEGSNKNDLGILFSQIPSDVAGVFTTNKVKSASVLICMERVKKGIAQVIVVNSGNANACTGERGLKDALLITKEVSKLLNIPEEYVLIASTGVIGKFLPMEKILPKIPLAVKNLSPYRGMDFQKAIMTTDTKPKYICKSFSIEDKEIKITGIAKGSGMIHPNLATMLVFIITDISISSSLLKEALDYAVEESFNMISIDGDTSTNDTVLILANGMAENLKIIEKNKDYDKFKFVLKEVCIYLAKEIAKDGEGATKLIEVKVINAPNKDTAKILARSVISSNLVKSAIYGEDANWGRIMCALGYADCDFNPSKVDIYIGDILVAKDGTFAPFDEKRAKKVLSQKEVYITIDLKAGNYSAISWGCDLTEEYVKINAKYPNAISPKQTIPHIGA
ncbi:MAG: bifunctional glutamate N-acetyltransferase/amino-acid acetyltransferase ArgJ [Dictyoglomaceae bacterium]